MTQKIIQVGNSIGVIIPRSLLEKAELSHGHEVEIELDENNNLIISKGGSTVKKSSINAHFLNVLDKVNKEYGFALKELSKR